MTLEYPLRVQPAVNAYRHQRAHRGNQALQGRHNKKIEENVIAQSFVKIILAQIQYIDINIYCQLYIDFFFL